MSQFPLNDDLRDARRARDEGYAGTVSGSRPVGFATSRRFAVPALVLAAVASIMAVSALRMPVVGLGRFADSDGRYDLASPMLGQHYTGVWVVVVAVLAAAALAVAAATWSGGPAPRRRGNPVLVVAGAVAGLLAVAAAVYLLAHTADWASQARAQVGPFTTPKGFGWRPGPLWPYRAAPGLGLWVCLAAALVSLVPPALLGVGAFLRGRRARTDVAPSVWPRRSWGASA